MEDSIEAALHTLPPEECNTYTMTIFITHHCLPWCWACWRKRADGRGGGRDGPWPGTPSVASLVEETSTPLPAQCCSFLLCTTAGRALDLLNPTILHVASLATYLIPHLRNQLISMRRAQVPPQRRFKVFSCDSPLLTSSEALRELRKSCEAMSLHDTSPAPLF